MSDIPLPDRKPRHQPLAGEREHERLSPGSFFAEGKALVDARRGDLARLGMDARHVEALRMPERDEKPLPVLGDPAVPMPVTADLGLSRGGADAPAGASSAHPIEDQPIGEFAPKRLPKEIEEGL